MFATVLLTTWNRPSLLRQSLPLIREESAANGWPLVVADDHSTDAETLTLLDQAAAEGVLIWRREYLRLDSDSAHVMTQLNNLFAFGEVVRTFPSTECILKVDDDIAMIPGAFGLIKKGWDAATGDYGDRILEVSGVRTCAEQILEQKDGYAITYGACNAAVLYRTSDWIKALDGIDVSKVLPHGFDGYMMNEYGRGRLLASLTPSVVYHAGHHGVHANGRDVNVDYCGSIEGITMS